MFIFLFGWQIYLQFLRKIIRLNNYLVLIFNFEYKRFISWNNRFLRYKNKNYWGIYLESCKTFILILDIIFIKVKFEWSFIILNKLGS
jgi:hypothetical protein